MGKSGVFCMLLGFGGVIRHKKSQSIKTGLIGFSESMIHMRIYDSVVG